MIGEAQLTYVRISDGDLVTWALLGVGAMVTLALLGFLVVMIVRERRKSKE